MSLFEQQTTDDLPTSKEDWVGEGKKYATEEDFVKAFAHAQSHIQRLEGQYAGLHEELAKRQTAEELFEKFGKPALEATEVTLAQESQTAGGSQSTNPVDEDAIFKRLEDKLNQSTKEQQAAANETAANDALIKRYGDSGKALSALQEKATALGKSLTEMKSLAQADPKLFLGLFPDRGDPRGNSTTSTSSLSPDALGRSSSNPNHPTYASYEEVRRTDPKRYWSPAFQLQLHKDAVKYGDAF